MTGPSPPVGRSSLCVRRRPSASVRREAMPGCPRKSAPRRGLGAARRSGCPGRAALGVRPRPRLVLFSRESPPAADRRFPALRNSLPPSVRVRQLRALRRPAAAGSRGARAPCRRRRSPAARARSFRPPSRGPSPAALRRVARSSPPRRSRGPVRRRLALTVPALAPAGFRPAKSSGFPPLAPWPLGVPGPSATLTNLQTQDYPDKRRGPLDHIGSDPLQTCPAASYSPTRSPAQYHRR